MIAHLIASNFLCFLKLHYAQYVTWQFVSKNALLLRLHMI